jgi:hypothetical protein
MEDIKYILVVSKMVKYDAKAIHFGSSLVKIQRKTDHRSCKS